MKLLKFIFLALSLHSSCSFAADYKFDNPKVLATQPYGIEAVEDVRQLNTLIKNLSGESDIKKLEQINSFFNDKIVQVDDIDVWHQIDYWATPLETIGHQAGDCEDFSIAKYMALRAAGISSDKLRLMFVFVSTLKDTKISTGAHIVVGYYPTPLSTPMILDNLFINIYPLDVRVDIRPVFSFNENTVWLSNNKLQATYLIKWNKVLLRMKQESLKSN